MKHTSKKLLLWLYTPSTESKPVLPRKIPEHHLDWLLGELTPDGRQSLVRHLRRERLLFTDQLEGHTRLSLSSHGRLQVEADFPAVKKLDQPWQGEWQGIVFLSPPSSDKNFRYLRVQLINELCIQLARGVYLHPGEISQTLKNLLHDSYRENVVVYKIDNWVFGDDALIIGQSDSLQGLITVYSGIGKELEDLLTKKAKQKGLSNQQKQRLSSIFDRFVNSFAQDSGIIPYYSPDSTSGISLLLQMQQGVEE